MFRGTKFTYENKKVGKEEEEAEKRGRGGERRQGKRIIPGKEGRWSISPPARKKKCRNMEVTLLDKNSCGPMMPIYKTGLRNGDEESKGRGQVKGVKGKTIAQTKS